MKFNNNMTFLIFKPDAIYQNIEKRMWAYFDSLGFELLKAKYGRITSHKRKSLYRDFHLSSRTNWDLGSEFYELGEALFLIVRGDYPKEQFSNLSQFVSKKIKGNFVPKKAIKGTIRGEFNALNPVFNLIHSSDDTESAEREAKIFFSEKELLRDYKNNISLLFKQRSEKPLSFYNELYHLKCMVLSLSGKPTKHLKEIINLNHFKIQGLNRNEKICALMECNEMELRVLEKLTIAPVYFNILYRILDYKNYSYLDYEQLFEDLKSCHINIGRWEKYLLKSSMYYLEFE